MFRISRFVATGFVEAGFLAIALSTTAAMAGQLGHGAWSSINPQPLPPRVLQGVLQGSAGIAIGPGARVMINPQPLPPRQQNAAYGIK